MKLLLTTSRNASQRVRQFIKEFSHLFPHSFVQRTNRGKKSLQELFDESLTKYNRILLITNKQGNPNKIIGYYKSQDNEFIWSFELKLKYVKLSYEFEAEPLEHPTKTKFQFQNLEPELEKTLNTFFEPFLTNNDFVYSEEILTVIFKHNKIGFEMYPIDQTDLKQAPEIAISEIIIEDPDMKGEID